MNNFTSIVGEYRLAHESFTAFQMKWLCTLSPNEISKGNSSSDFSLVCIDITVIDHGRTVAMNARLYCERLDVGMFNVVSKYVVYREERRSIHRSTNVA